MAIWNRCNKENTSSRNEFDVASVIREVDKNDINQFVEKLIIHQNMKSCFILLPYGGAIISYQKIYLGS